MTAKLITENLGKISKNAIHLADGEIVCVGIQVERRSSIQKATLGRDVEQILEVYPDTAFLVQMYENGDTVSFYENDVDNVTTSSRHYRSLESVELRFTALSNMNVAAVTALKDYVKTAMLDQSKPLDYVDDGSYWDFVGEFSEENGKNLFNVNDFTYTPPA